MARAPATAFIFHRDLRIIDNLALEAAAAADQPIIPIFIFTPEQVTRNSYKSANAIQFMLESLEDLDAALRHKGSRLHCFYGKTEDVLRALPAHITTVADGADYTPYAKARTAAIRRVAGETGRVFIQTDDIYLFAPGTILNKAGRPYQKFTPFYEAVLDHSPFPKPKTATSATFTTYRFPPAHGATTLAAMWEKLVPKKNPSIHAKGGRTEGLRLLRALPRILPRYETAKDIPAMETSGLSAHNHFGTVSIREVAASAAAHGPATTGTQAFIRQLIWREFYGHIMAAFEELYGVSPYEFKHAKPGPAERRWAVAAADPAALVAWKAGKTGHPVVDAGMRQLRETGYIPNRVRLICGSYLVNELGISWKEGEKHFSQYLVDIDFAQNTGNWTWLGGGLPYSQNPLRIMKVERQEERFDPDGEYSSKWLSTSPHSPS
jgi:deoxyribodipyrimidine photo-lyase